MVPKSHKIYWFFISVTIAGIVFSFATASKFEYRLFLNDLQYKKCQISAPTERVKRDNEVENFFEDDGANIHGGHCLTDNDCSPVSYCYRDGSLTSIGMFLISSCQEIVLFYVIARS